MEKQGTMEHGLFHTQNRLHEDLTAYINNCALTRTGRIAGLVSRRLASLGHVSRLAERYREFSRTSGATTTVERISVKPYTGSNLNVMTMMKKLEILRHQLAGAYVHGSLATGEELPYSDFDGLVIIRSEVFDSPSCLSALAYRLSSLRRVMHRQDPLQHHGWFVLSETDLLNYCDAYFPAALFEYSRSLYPDLGTELKIQKRDSSAEVRDIFTSLCDSLLTRIRAGYRPKNLYQAKSIMSALMLLPSLYLEYKHGRGIYKKFSFDIASRDFAPEVWQPMETASTIRGEWSYSLSWPVRILLTFPVSYRHFIRNLAVPAIPQALENRLDDKFFSSIEKLVTEMQNNAVRTHCHGGT
jgi:hypothetical protein